MSVFPYTLLTGDELRISMNKFSERGEAFFVLISYDTQSGYFIPIAGLDQNWIQFSFQGKLHQAPVREPIHSPVLREDCSKTQLQSAEPEVKQDASPDARFCELSDQPEMTDWLIFPVDKELYSSRFELVQQHLKRGNSFLVNLTQPTPIRTPLSLLDLYCKARAPYKVWLKDKLVCFSPECFVTIADGEIRTFPMKGTVDAALPDAMNKLLENEKEKAEHATIVDLLRNDVSMVATDVDVTRYRYVDRIKTHRGELLQVSSEIRGRLVGDYRSQLGDIVFTMLPAGSICGAPKSRTLEVIAEAESYDRGFYTGICGFFDGDSFDSAVMIRYVEQTPVGLVFKSGGGITYRSEMEQEYHELIQKVYVPV